jgi:putative ABC transport system permease protein
MMASQRISNRTMFWRIVRSLLGANRSRLFVLLLALGAGSAITAALLNLQIDAERRLTTEFRAFGANVVIAPRDAGGSANPTLSQSLGQGVPRDLEGQHVSVLSVLYVMVDVTAPDSQDPIGVVAAGQFGDLRAEIFEKKPTGPDILTGSSSIKKPECWAGSRVADRLHVKAPAVLTLRTDQREEQCRLDYVRSTGGPEDDQISVRLDMAQRLAASPGRISVIQIGAPGTPAAVDRYIASLAQDFPEVDVRPIRQFTQAEGSIYNRVSGLLTATVVLVLILTALCVMAGMTNAAMERKNDVGLMKAIGGATRRVLRLFIAEAAVLGLIGGAIGAAAGIVLSIWLGQTVFGVAARPRLIVYPIAVILTVVVAIAGALPLRRLATVRPASIFRGAE